MASLQETLDLVSAEDTTIDSVLALLSGVQAEVAEFLSGAKVAPAVQTGIDAIFEKAKGSKDKLDAALAANVPTP